MIAPDRPTIDQHDETARLQRIDLFSNVVIWAMAKLKDQDRKIVNSWLVECVLPMIDTMTEKDVATGLSLHWEGYGVWTKVHKVSFDLYRDQLAAGPDPLLAQVVQQTSNDCQ